MLNRANPSHTDYSDNGSGTLQRPRPRYPFLRAELMYSWPGVGWVFLNTTFHIAFGSQISCYDDCITKSVVLHGHVHEPDPPMSLGRSRLYQTSIRAVHTCSHRCLRHFGASPVGWRLSKWCDRIYEIHWFVLWKGINIQDTHLSFLLSHLGDLGTIPNVYFLLSPPFNECWPLDEGYGTFSVLKMSKSITLRAIELSG